MKNQIQKNKALIASVLLLAFLITCPLSAFAWGGRGGHGGRDHYSYRGGHGDYGHYYYHGGHWYHSGWFWGWFGAGLAIGTIVATLPPYYETVYVGGNPYYYYDNAYYRPCPSGYVVVQAPATTTIVTAPAVTQPYAMYGQTVVVNVPNARGGYTAVTLTRHGTGYLGPQGEYYEGNPTVEQLRALYGN